MRNTFATLLGATAGLIAFALLETANAQSTTSSIPTGISASCSAVFQQFDADKSISACTKPLLSATEYYTNATSASSKANAEAALKESLDELCSANQGCNSDLIRQYLASFWTACRTDIVNQQKQVQDHYDVLYLLNPFRQAICSTNDDGEYCLTQVANTSTTTDSEKRSLPQEIHRRLNHQAESLLQSRQSDDGESVSDAASAVESISGSGSNLAFLFLQPTADEDVLCSTCAQNILASYIEFETSIPYAIGLANSDILGGQSALYKAGQKACGNKWAVKINQIAGTTDFAKVAGALGGARITWSVALGGILFAAAALAL